MDKVGIITFHRAINYGAVLQAYALQKVFCDLGADCQIVDFRCRDIERYYQPFNVYRSSLISMVNQFGKALLNYNSRRKKKQKTELFVSKYLKLSEPVYSDLEKLNNAYDIFVTGSDQVFNPDIAGKDALVYFLSFARKPRFSYAASFGKNFVADSWKESIRAELEKYKKISVREESGKEIVKDLTGSEAEINVDPTLLLTADNWRSIESKPKGIIDRYVLVYNMLPTELLYEAAKELSNKVDIKVIVVNNKSHMYKVKYPDFVFMDNCSPEEFLWLVDHAEYVLSSSFHGNVFSILFHKRFISILPKDEPKNARTISLLQITGLDNLIYTDKFNLDRAFQKVDWDAVDYRIKAQRNASINYVRSILEGI